MRPRIGWLDHLLGALLCAGYVALLLGTSADLAMSRDESFYVTAAQDYARWMRQLWNDPDAALTTESIDAAWDYNHEHPGLAKALFALSWIAHENAKSDAGGSAASSGRTDEGGLFASDSDAFRFPGMLSAGLLLWLLYIFGARVFGREAGAFAAVAYALMPRPFYHAHLDCFDVPITLALTFAVYAYWRALTSRGWIVMAGVAWGLALAVKHNSWVLPGIFLIHYVWMVLAARARAKRDLPASARLVTRPWWLVSLAWLGPPIFLATWPWLWHPETMLERFGWYARFHVNHEYYTIAYLGRSWFEPPFPISYPFVLTAITVPLVTLAMAGVGIAMRARAMLPGFVRDRLWKNGDVEPDSPHTDVLLIGCMLAPILMIALPSTPIFGGTKHWFPAYPFLCMYAGLGIVRATNALRHGIGVRLPASRWTSRVLVSALVIAPMLVQTVHSHPFGLSHYTPIAGGVPGAADLGMNRQFWGFTTGSLTEYFTEQMPNGGTVYLCDMTPGAWEMLHRDGLLPRNVRWSASLTNADFVMVHHEDHFLEVELQSWIAFGTTKPAHVLTYDGVPIITVYENPRRRR